MDANYKKALKSSYWFDPIPLPSEEWGFEPLEIDPFDVWIDHVDLTLQDNFLPILESQAL